MGVWSNCHRLKSKRMSAHAHTFCNLSEWKDYILKICHLLMNEEQKAIPECLNVTKKERVRERKLSRQTERQCKPISHVCLHLKCCVCLVWKWPECIRACYVISKPLSKLSFESIDFKGIDVVGVAIQVVLGLRLTAILSENTGKGDVCRWEFEMREIKINLCTIKLRLSNVQTSWRVVCMQARALKRDAFFSLVPFCTLLSHYIVWMQLS